MRYLSILYLAFFFQGLSVVAQDKDQEKIQILTKPKNGSIYIRWTPSSPADWQTGNNLGYTLVRETVRKNNKKLSKAEDKQTRVLKLASKAVWDSLVLHSEYAKVPKGYFFDDPIIPNELSKEEEENAIKGRMIFTLLAADLDFEVAQKLGLGFVDNSAQPDFTYKYTILLNGGSKKKIETYASLDDRYIAKAPADFQDLDFADSSVTLKWAINERDNYSAYTVEQSADNGVTFVAANLSPILPMSNDTELNEVSYGHKVKKLHIYYEYRVRGIDPFGELGPATKPIRFFAFNSSLVPPENLKHAILSKTSLALSWTFPDSLKNDIKGFNVYRNFGPNDVIQHNKKTIDKNQPIYVSEILPTDENVIYKVTAVDLRGREIFSEPYLVSIIDSIPPQKVNSLEAEVDKNGIVKLCWSAPSDLDVYAYNILRAEGNLKNDFYPVKQIEGKGMNQVMVLDTITIGKGTYPYLYYMVVPSDFHTNYTLVNDSIKVFRPDIDPPIPPSFDLVAYTDTSGIFKFSPSQSLDVKYYNFYKAYPPDTTKKLLKSILPDSLALGYVDFDTPEETEFKYVLEAIDHSGLSSGDSCNTILRIDKPFARPPVNTIEGKYDKQNKSIVLKWDYKSRVPLEAIYIFKQKNETGQFVVGTKLDSTKTFWEDTDINEKYTYSYYLMVTCTDGTSSSKGKIVKINAK
jgi:uncharacterized protein